MENLILEIIRRILFRFLRGEPQNILVFKVGNIGDMVCAIPSFIAIRETYPRAHITLLTSPGKRGAPGASDFLEGAFYFDDIRVYYADDIVSRAQKKKFLSSLKNKHYDLFIQIPDDWADFHTLFRNLLFARLVGAQYAFGFRVRTFLSWFRKTQVDYTLEKNEVESLLEVLETYEIHTKQVRFELPLSEKAKPHVRDVLSKKWGDVPKVLVAVCPGGKYEEKLWPVERFGEVACYLNKKYGAKIVLIGGQDDKKAMCEIEKYLSRDDIACLAGTLSITEQSVLLKHCIFLLSNDAGPMHLAAAVETPTVALFSVRNILGKWFPYGTRNRIIYKRFLGCNYRGKSCIKKSMESITIDEVKAACDMLMKERDD